MTKESLTEKELKALREKEHEEILIHLKGVIDILHTICRRCESYYGCLGCVFSPGDGLKGMMAESVKYMRIQDKKMVKKVFNLSDHGNYDQEQEDFKKLIEDIRKFG